MRAGEKTCHYVAEHYRLSDPFEQYGDSGSEYEDECEVAYEALDL